MKIAMITEGDIVRVLRGRDVSQDEFGSILGINQDLVSRWECNKQEIRARDWLHIARVTKSIVPFFMGLGKGMSEFFRHSEFIDFYDKEKVA